MLKRLLSALSRPQPEETVPAGGGPEATVLIVDDDSVIRDLIKFRLEARQYRVLTAVNGREGVEVARKERPDAIILDGSMPEMDGFEALRRLRRDRRTARTPVIMLTARIREGDVLTGFRYGAQEYLTKPVIMDELLRSLQSILKDKR